MGTMVPSFAGVAACSKPAFKVSFFDRPISMATTCSSLKYQDIAPAGTPGHRDRKTILVIDEQDKMPAAKARDLLTEGVFAFGLSSNLFYQPYGMTREDWALDVAAAVQQAIEEAYAGHDTCCFLARKIAEDVYNTLLRDYNSSTALLFDKFVVVGNISQYPTCMGSEAITVRILGEWRFRWRMLMGLAHLHRRCVGGRSVCLMNKWDGGILYFNPRIVDDGRIPVWTAPISMGVSTDSFGESGTWDVACHELTNRSSFRYSLPEYVRSLYYLESYGHPLDSHDGDEITYWPVALPAISALKKKLSSEERKAGRAAVASTGVSPIAVSSGVQVSLAAYAACVVELVARFIEACDRPSAVKDVDEQFLPGGLAVSVFKDADGVHTDVTFNHEVYARALVVYSPEKKDWYAALMSVNYASRGRENGTGYKRPVASEDLLFEALGYNEDKQFEKANIEVLFFDEADDDACNYQDEGGDYADED